MNSLWERAKANLSSEVVPGLLAAWPICLGYIPIGLAFGVLAQKAGLHPVAIGLMSLLVFAGSAQFIAISMLSAGAGILPIIVTTFAVNLRHFLMSSALAPYLSGVKKRTLSLFSYGITDESFAVNLLRFREGNWNITRGLIVNHTANITWIACSILGGYGGHLIPPQSFGIDYALIAMFIALLALQLRGYKYAVVAIVAGGLGVVFSLLFSGNMHIVLASLLAVVICAPLVRKFS